MAARGTEPVIGPTWVLGTIVAGVVVAALLSEGTVTTNVAGIGIALISILLAIGLAAEKVVLAIERTASRDAGDRPAA